MEVDSAKSKTSFSAVCFSTLEIYINHKNNKTTGFALGLIPHGNFPTVLKTDCCCCCKSTAGKHYISLFGEKSAEEALVEAIQNYGKKIVVEKDIAVVSTKLCRSCCLHDGILHYGMDAKTLENTRTQRVRRFIFTRSYSQFLFLKFLLWCLIDLFADTAAILISIVSEDIMGCSGGKLICICPLGIP